MGEQDEGDCAISGEIEEAVVVAAEVRHDEAEEEEEPMTSSISLDWNKLFKMAEDPDMEDILRGPIDTALYNLQAKKEETKLKAIRDFPKLLDSDGEECIQRLIPAIQEVLTAEKSNLDVHCEASIMFKEVLQNDILCQRFPGLTDTLLELILQNITDQKDNQSSDNKVRLQMGAVPHSYHLNAAAWLETLVGVADRVSTDALRQYIVPVVQQQAEPVQRVQRRIIATKLLHKLADILPSNEVRKELGPCAQMLCQDANSNVRTAMAQRLPVIARALKNASDTVALLLPCFVQLCRDEELTVREACMNNLAQCLPHFTNDAKKSTIFPLIKKTTEQSLEKKEDVLMVIAKHLAEWSFTLSEVLDQLDLSWILNTYLKIVSISQTSDKNSSTQAMLTMCRRMSSFNFPCIVEMFPKAFDRLLPVFEAFCTDSDDEVRLAMAASFHEVLARQPERAALLQPFMELIRGGAPEVVSKITRNLDKMLPILYKLAAAPGGKVTWIQLNRILIGCNQLLRGTGAWRGHEALLNSLAVLRHVLPFSQLHETFVPVLQKEVLQVRALPCRIAAVNTLLLFLREQPDKTRREEIINFFRLEVATHSCSYRRSLFLDTVEAVLRIFSRRFFIQYFLPDTIKLTLDNISNVRLRAVRLLPRVKSFFILPEDDNILLEVERSVREALSKEKQTNTRQLIQAAACDLSRCEARLRGDKADSAKVEEEERLWSEERLREAEKSPPKDTRRRGSADTSSSSGSGSGSPKPSGLRPPTEPTRSVSPWRSQRKAVAIVRPQPVVVMRSASPAPKFDSNRPSRLPLSVASREKEALKKTMRESSLPHPTPRSSSLSTRSVMSTSASASSGSSSPGPGSPTNYGLRRSATTSTGFGSVTSSQSSYPLMSSRSTTSIRRPTYGLTRVSSHSTLERKPPQLSVKIRGVGTN